MSRAKTPVQTPGDTPTTSTDTPTGEATGAATEAGQPTADAFQAQGTQLNPPAVDPGAASMEQLQAMVEAQNRQIAALLGAVENLQRVQTSPAAQVAQASELPKLKDVDLAAINAGSTPVLTQEGWVVPPTHGTDPARLQELRDAAVQRQLNAALTQKLIES